MMHEHRAEILRVVDGDTLECRIDHDWSIYSVQKVRLAGLNAPELRGPGGEAAKAAVEAWVKNEALPWVVLRSEKPDPRDKYGRYLVTVTSRTGSDLGAELIAAGHAVRWDGRGTRP